ncbi:41150_t:CDS:2, partial [Gigaspora margarita]
FSIKTNNFQNNAGKFAYELNPPDQINQCSKDDIVKKFGSKFGSSFQADHVFEAQIVSTYFKCLMLISPDDATALCNKVSAKLDDLKTIMNDGGNIRYLSLWINSDKGSLFRRDNLGTVTAMIFQISTPSATIVQTPIPSIIVLSPAERSSAVANYLTNYIPIVADLTIDVGLSFCQASRSVYESLTNQPLEDYSCGIFGSNSPEPPTMPVPFDVPAPSAENEISVLETDE